MISSMDSELLFFCVVPDLLNRLCLIPSPYTDQNDFELVPSLPDCQERYKVTFLLAKSVES